MDIHASTHQPTNPSTHHPSSDFAIKVDHVSKKYCKSLKRSMLYGVNDIGRNMLGLSSRSERLRKDEFWAVDDVSFEVKKGETLGIIGPNGSGKTTLLKMLNGIFWPDKGKITVKGRVGALIEVGAGFHPLLTGRENAYINAAILGMTKKEVDEKFDDIVEFADIGDFIDAPVKFYSSGMFVRLGFAVAVHCEPDILLVDEILAVGDACFRRKCIEKISNLMDRGVSIVLVSHHVYFVRGLCKRTIFLNNGKIFLKGSTAEIMVSYEKYVQQKLGEKRVYEGSTFSLSPMSSKDLTITNVDIFNKEGLRTDEFGYQDDMLLKIHFIAHRRIGKPVLVIRIVRSDGKICCMYRSIYEKRSISESVEGPNSFSLLVGPLQLVSGTYFIDARITGFEDTVVLAIQHSRLFTVESPALTSGGNAGIFVPHIKWLD